VNLDEAPLWLFGDQLGPHLHSGAEHAHRQVVLIEASSALRRKPYHRQKLHLVLSGLRHLAAELGERAVHLRATTYREALQTLGRPVLVQEPTSRSAEDFVHRLQADGLVAAVLPTPSFALSRTEFAHWARGRESFRLETFYREQRRRFDVLMDAGEPVGGRWNLDADNREPAPKGGATLGVPPPWWPTEDAIDDEVRTDLDRMALDTVGVDGPRLFPVTRGEAEQALSQFIATRLSAFGPHEDAVLAQDWPMAHSLLSVPLNLGLLHPLEVVRAAEAAYTRGEAPLAGVEGFIRQVLGWREYVWQLYWHLGADYLHRNALDARVPLPQWWRELDDDSVQAACLADALRGVRERGWVHHIPRLMVLGSHALQRGYDPRELTDWFATAFVDGFAWVMPVNVVGMSQHADGGLIATKPYTSGGAYLNRMTDHCGGCVYNPKRRVGEDACPFTAGYWAFTHRHRERLAANNRTAGAVSSMHRVADLPAVLAQEEHREQF
jgi:deoxyribodipyrimidine photolyase-related protein